METPGQDTSGGGHRGTLESGREGGGLEREAARPKRTHSQTRVSSSDATEAAASQREKRRWRRSDQTWSTVSTPESSHAGASVDESILSRDGTHQDDSNRHRSRSKVSLRDEIDQARQAATTRPVATTRSSPVAAPQAERPAGMDVTGGSTDTGPTDMGLATTPARRKAADQPRSAPKAAAETGVPPGLDKALEKGVGNIAPPQRGLACHTRIDLPPGVTPDQVVDLITEALKVRPHPRAATQRMRAMRFHCLRCAGNVH
jgi:hypothetical protein